MKQLYKKYAVFTLFLFSIIFSISAQNTGDLWAKNSKSEQNKFQKIERKSIPTDFEIYNLNLNLLEKELINAPKRKSKSIKSKVVLSFPNGNGKFEKYQIFETPILEDALQKKYPNIRSYIGKSISNPNSVVRFSVTSMGLHALVFQKTEQSIYIDPYTSNKQSYIVYKKKSLPEVDQFQCKGEEVKTTTKIQQSNITAKAENANDGILRTFRLAVATTGEYSQFHLTNQGISATATDAEKKRGSIICNSCYND